MMNFCVCFRNIINLFFFSVGFIGKLWDDNESLSFSNVSCFFFLNNVSQAASLLQVKYADGELERLGDAAIICC